MGFSLIPEFSFLNVTDIPPEFFKENGIRFIMVDLDNTLAAYDEHYPADEMLSWVANVKKSGITTAIISNSSRVMRVYTFAEAFDINSAANARKPSTGNMLHLMETSGFSVDESALIGDQIFTDVLCANLAQMTSIIIKPRKFTNIFLLLRYIIELPFRYFTRRKL
jgi:HAD superfamily phosphatase (TIGR01668 family)